VTALERAVALEQMDDIALAVAEHLHFDVARRSDAFLDQHAVVAEAARRLALRAFERVVKVLRRVDLTHALAAPACDGLDQHRIADRARFLLERLGVLVVAEIAGSHRHARLGHQLLRRILQAHRADAVRFGPDPDQARVDHRLGEVRILGQEAVAGVDRLGLGRLRRRDDLVADQIALARRTWADVHRLVGHAHVKRISVSVGIDRDRPDPHAPRGSDHAARDLAAVGDQQRLHQSGRQRPLSSCSFAEAPWTEQ
jgi:hypothetical protein